MEQVNEAIVKKGGGARLKKGGKGPLVAVCLVLALLAGGYAGLCAYAVHSPAIWKDTYVLGQNLGGLTEAEAIEAVETALPELQIGLYLYDSALEPQPERGETPDATIPLSELNAEIDVAAFVREAQASHLKGAHFLSAGWLYLTNPGVIYGGGPEMLVVDTAAAGAAAKKSAEALSWATQDTTYTMTDNAVSVQTAKDGRTVDREQLQAGLERGYWDLDLGMNVPYTTETAKTLTAQEIYDQTAGEAQNAGYDFETDSITPEKIGAEFDVAAAQRLLDAAQPGETVEIPAQVRFPTVTAAELEALLFRDVLGEATTTVSGTAARRSNVKLSAATINNHVMNTGDLFSYNEVVGKRTAANGYQAAPAYVHGETVDEIGGGICQTSSTLYLACLRANLEITERYAHRYVPNYIPWGMDATVSWGGPDYKFTNDMDYPVRIVTTYENNQLTVQILGTNIDGISAKITNEVLSSTPWETVYEEDPSVAPGTERQKTSPYTGYQVRTYQTIYDADGKVIDSHYEATSSYKSRNKVILKAPGELPVPEVPVVAPGTVSAGTTPTTSTTTPETPATTPSTSTTTTPETPIVTPEVPVVTTPETPATPEAPDITPDSPIVVPDLPEIPEIQDIPPVETTTAA